METLKISAVSYLNTLPFVYGIKYSGELADYDLQLDVPAECARKFIKKQVDFALVPVAALKKMKNYWMIDEYCIGSNGKVRTVALLSKVPLDKINRVYLDFHSLTSVNLVKILAKHHWKISPQWVKLDEMTQYNLLRLESLVAIGDKVFLLEDEFEYIYDLAAEWKKFNGLPFVFACWVVQKGVKEEKIKRFIRALEWGVSRKQLAIEYLFDTKKFPCVDIKEYLEKNIDFIFDAPKRKAFDLFLNYME